MGVELSLLDGETSPVTSEGFWQPVIRMAESMIPAVKKIVLVILLREYPVHLSRGSRPASDGSEGGCGRTIHFRIADYQGFGSFTCGFQMFTYQDSRPFGIPFT